MTDNQSVREAAQRLTPLVRQDIPFQEKVHDVLSIGCQCLDLTQGFLSRVNRQPENVTILASATSTDQSRQSGVDNEIVNTYCRRTVDEDDIVTVDSAVTSETAGGRSEEAHVGCYIGAPIKVENELYGTLSFLGEDQRAEGFSNTAVLFVTLTAQILERELTRQRSDSELSRETNRATVLNRVLRHNLRNSMSVIRGYTQLMGEKLEDEQLSATTLRHVDQLLELSKKARVLDRLIRTGSEYQHTDITTLAADTADTVAELYPGATIEVHTDEVVRATVMPSLKRCLRELVENAAKHRGNPPEVTVTVADRSDTVSIEIADNGPGLPDIEADILDHGREVPLSHGRGLGLWTAYWIVSTHGGTIESRVTDEGTTVTVRLPRKADAGEKEGVARLISVRDRYEAAFEEAPDPMFILNNDARILDANAEAAAMLAVSSKEVLGRSLADFYQGPKQFDAVWSEITSKVETRDTITVESSDEKSHVLEYTSRTSILPDNHLLIGRVISDSAESTASGNS